MTRKPILDLYDRIAARKDRSDEACHKLANMCLVANSALGAGVGFVIVNKSIFVFWPYLIGMAGFGFFVTRFFTKQIELEEKYQRHLFQMCKELSAEFSELPRIFQNEDDGFVFTKNVQALSFQLWLAVSSLTFGFLLSRVFHGQS